MNNIQLLDCTLRDGGFNNDWNFGKNTIVNVFERLVSSEIDYIEVGFLDQRRDYDINRTIIPSTKDLDLIFDKLEKSNTKVVAMIDYGTCDISNISPCSESFIDGIRVIFKMHMMYEALDFCKQLKELGYLVFTQAVSITSYSDEKIVELIKLVNEIKPYAVSAVDTYGLLFKNNLFHYYKLIDDNLDKDIAIGYHAHNNFQLAFSNCIELAQLHKDNPRTLLLDGSLFGMGKGAGNTPTELLAMYMNDNLGTNYNVSQLLEAIDTSIVDLYKKYQWGYALKYFIAASNDCHPSYVSYLLDRNTLSVHSINQILNEIEEEKKLLYDKSYIDNLYLNYQLKYKAWDDYISLASLLGNRTILLLGPGCTIISEREKIDRFIKGSDPIIISVNFVPEEIDTDLLFITNSKRYIQQASAIKRVGEIMKIIATSNVTKTVGNFDFTIDYESLIDPKGDFIDHSLIMLLKSMIQVGVSNVYLAGFDGFSKEQNFYFSKEEEKIDEKYILLNNNYVNKSLAKLQPKLNINFITTSKYHITK